MCELWDGEWLNANTSENVNKQLSSFYGQNVTSASILDTFHTFRLIIFRFFSLSVQIGIETV